MTFSEALSQILSVYNIKTSRLAQALGYDVSYLSKWISGAKLPSEKSAEQICEKIAQYAASEGGSEEQWIVARKFDLYGIEAENYVCQLSEKLYSFFLNQKEAPYAGSMLEKNSVFLEEPSSVADEIIKEVISLYRSGSEREIEGVLIMPGDFIRSDSIDIVNRICSEEARGKILHLRQILGRDSFPNDTDELAKCVLKYLSLNAPIRIDFFSPQDESSKQQPTLVIRDGVLIQAITDSFSGTHSFSLISHEKAIVNKYYRLADAHIKQLSPLAVRIKREDIIESNIPYSYVIQSDCRYVMRGMVPVHLDEALLDEFLGKYLEDMSQYDYQKKMHSITYSSNNSVLTYKKTLIDYMNTGRIRLFDSVVKISREDRKRQLMSLIESMEEGTHVSLGILNDKNPVWNYEDSSLTVYMNEYASFAVNDANDTMNEIISFISEPLNRDIRRLYDNLAQLPAPYLKKDKKAIDYIYNGIRLI